MATYDSRTALVVVDVQNDFADPRGSLAVAGGEEILPFLNDEIRHAREAGATIVYTQDWHPAQTPHFVTQGGVWPPHCVRDSWGAAFHPRLDVTGEVVRKGEGGEDGYSGFFVRDPLTGRAADTGLAHLLRERGVQRAVVVGLATDYCVKETAIDASREGFATIVLARGVRAVDRNPGDGESALAAMRSAGVTVEPA
ncbi:MAG: isochorismatase family protein [Dehalococcoidia bacterium]|nr:isochorismatase family protein [Dehalococcoidia bacterium]